MVSTPPKSLSPAVESSELSREVALEVLHESSQLGGGGGAQQKVKVVAQEAVCVELDSKSGQRVREDADNDGVGFGRGAQEKPALEAAVGDEVDGGRTRVKA